MIRKSAWLLSAGLFILAAPASGQTTSQSNTDTDKGAAQPTEGATAEAAAVSDQAVDSPGVARLTVIHRDAAQRGRCQNVPMASARHRGIARIYRRDRSSANQFPLAARFFPPPSEPARAWPESAHRTVATTRPRKLVGVFIDGVYRSRTSAALT